MFHKLQQDWRKNPDLWSVNSSKYIIWDVIYVCYAPYSCFYTLYFVFLYFLFHFNYIYYFCFYTAVDPSESHFMVEGRYKTKKHS